MSWFEALVLGVVQGLTEFLPISSSAHILILSNIFGWGDPGAAFTAVTQIGTEMAPKTSAKSSRPGPNPWSNRNCGETSTPGWAGT